MKLSRQLKDKLLGIAAVIIVAVAGLWMVLGGTEHIVDTNGPEDPSIQTITDQQIIDLSVGSVGGPNRSVTTLSGDMVNFSADKFTGVYEILYDNYILPSDFEVNLVNYSIRGGNFKIVVVHEEKIVAELEPGLFPSFRMENVEGYVSLRMVGESASFSFGITQFDYDLHSYPPIGTD